MIIAKLALMANAIKQAIPLWVWAVLAALLAFYLWGNTRYDAGVAHERAVREQIILEAQIAAVEAERHAQAKHEERETERHSHTTELREAAAAAPVGEKTKAVLDALRNS